jgi:hypothetical protein
MEKNPRGNQGYGKNKFVAEMIDRYSATWWTEWELMMTGEDKNDKKFAMAEFNKLQIKAVPQDVNADVNATLQWLTQSPSRTSQEDGQDNSTTAENVG